MRRFGALYAHSGCLFAALFSIGEAIWSPRLYEYTASVAPKGRSRRASIEMDPADRIRARGSASITLR